MAYRRLILIYVCRNDVATTASQAAVPVRIVLLRCNLELCGFNAAVWVRCLCHSCPSFRPSCESAPQTTNTSRKPIAIANEVVQMPDPKATERNGLAPISLAPRESLWRECNTCSSGGDLCPKCEQEEKLRRKERGSATEFSSTAPSIVDRTLSSPGQPIETATRAYFESRFGRSLSEVRVHTDEGAARSARAVNALAYTAGRDIVFGSDQYAPRLETGSGLLAHELTDVLQQGTHRCARPNGTPPEEAWASMST